MKTAKTVKKITAAAAKLESKVQKDIQKHLVSGKEKLIWLENQINDEKNHEKIKAYIGNAREKVTQLRDRFLEYEKKAVHYAEKNPKKALAMAGAAGVLAASLWNAFRQPKAGSSAQTSPKVPVSAKPISKT